MSLDSINSVQFNSNSVFAQFENNSMGMWMKTCIERDISIWYVFLVSKYKPEVDCEAF